MPFILSKKQPNSSLYAYYNIVYTVHLNQNLRINPTNYQHLNLRINRMKPQYTCICNFLSYLTCRDPFIAHRIKAFNEIKSCLTPTFIQDLAALAPKYRNWLESLPLTSSTLKLRAKLSWDLVRTPP